MKPRIIALGAAISLTLGACSLFADEEKKTETREATTIVYDGVKDGSTYEYLYIDLDAPETVLSSGSNTEWDIRITGQREVFTNSGTTAASSLSSGTGGVVFSGETDMDASVSTDDAENAFDADSNDGKDYAFWDKYKTTSATPTSASTGNAISFPGYKSQDSRDGTSADTAWVFGAVGDHVDVDFSLGSAYAEWERMDPQYSNFNNNVYFVRSGDGTKYYKLQIPEVVYTASSSSSDGKTHYTFKITFVQLD